MKKYAAILGGVVILSIVALSMASLTAGQTSDDSENSNLLSASPQIQITPAPAFKRGELAVASSGQFLWFVPQDTPYTATVLILDNTNTWSVAVKISVYETSGAGIGTYTISLDPGKQVRVCSDQPVSLEGCWSGTLYANFTGTAARALLDLPAGVLVDGYVVWNGLGDTFNPGAAVPTLPLRFLNALAQ
jgi:hypothetical protein